MNENHFIDESVARLRSHFGRKLLVFPPFTTETLHRIVELVGRVPDDLMVFLRSHNGLRIDIEGREDTALWGTQEMMAHAIDPASSIVPRCFLPIRGDPTGERDWLITEFDPAFGAIVRWNPWTPAIRLMASSLGSYLSGWVDFLTACYGPDGKALSSRPHSTFNASWIKNDPCIAKLRHDPVVAEWLGKVAEAATCNEPGCREGKEYVLCGPMCRKQTVS